MPEKEAEVAWEKYAMSHDVHDFKARYQTYKSEVESKIRAVLSDVSLYQGVVGMFMLTVVARWVFANLGLRMAVSILPAFALLALIAFSFPLEILSVELILVFSGSFNYALNNATKEILYSATSEETKFKHKPLIEGPFMRLGDITASILKLGTGALAVAAAWSGDAGDRIFLAITFSLVLIWWKAIVYAGRTYDQRRASYRRSQEAS
jgi:ATP/ADP translocase